MRTLPSASAGLACSENMKKTYSGSGFDPADSAQAQPRHRGPNVRASYITARGEISFKMFDLPQSVIEIMIVLNSDSFVFSLDVLGAH